MHFILIWVLVLRGVQVRPWMLALSVVVEVLARAALAGTAGPYVAYMAVPNWMTVFLLGLYHGQRPEEAPAAGPARPLIGLGLLTLAWPALVGPCGRRTGRPLPSPSCAWRSAPARPAWRSCPPWSAPCIWPIPC